MFVSGTRRRFLAGSSAALGALFGLRLPPGTPLVWAGPQGHPTPEVTPTDRLYVQSWNRTPSVDASRWTLDIAGEVARPLTLTAADLAARAQVRQYVTLICIGNTVSGEQIGNVEWTGVRLADLLAEARPRPSARKLLVTAADRFTQTLTLDLAADPATLVAVGMNGGPLTADHGHPARLVVPGRYGVKSVKWVTRIEAVPTDAVVGYWEQRGWDDAAIVRTTSRVDTPGFFQRLSRSPVLVAGVAYAGRRGIASVEVSTDGTQTWQPASVRPALGPFAWSLWAYVWTPTTAGEHVLAARATDGEGGRQSTTRERAFPKGAGGLHEVIVHVLPSAI
ncbi:MAG TPA: molybdopterin-dependent oxidoreductase [Thermodesulfobacteriota bacterium]